MRRFSSSLPAGSLFAVVFTAGFGLSADAAGPSAGDDARTLRREGGRVGPADVGASKWPTASDDRTR